jgi:hypothetical protein
MFGQAARFSRRIDVSGIPVSLSLGQAFTKGEVNQTLSVTVSLKNSQGAAVAALKDEKVQLHYGSQVQDGVIPAGARSATFQITPHTPGVAKVEATDSNLAGASELVLAVDKNATIMKRAIVPGEALPPPPPPPPTGGQNRRFGKAVDKIARVAAPEPTSTPPPASAPASPSATLKVFVTPDNIGPDPETGQWKAQIALALMGPNDELITSDRDVPLQLVAQQGQINPSQVTIKKDESSTFATPASLTSNSAGTDTISVFSSLPRVQQTVTYQTPQPSQLHLEATPASVINDGKSPIRIVVLLVDSGNNTVRAAVATPVTLTSSRGNLAPIQITIPAGEYSAEAALSSQQNGEASVTAEASGLKSAQTLAAFLFPWMMVTMGALGGMLGATVHNPKGAFSKKWWTVVLLGVICGVVLCIAALFGAIGALPKLGLPIQISQIPSANELGALLLGFVGGFYGKKFWLKGDSDKPEQAAGQAAAKTT